MFIRVKLFRSCLFGRFIS